MLKVVLINDYATVVGGAERFLDNVIHLAKYNEIVFEQIHLSEFMPAIGKGIRGAVQRRYYRMQVFPAMIRALHERLSLIQPDIIHLNNNNLLTNSVHQALEQSRIPVVCFLHDRFALERLGWPWYRHHTRSFTFLTHAPDIMHRLRRLGRKGHLIKVPFDYTQWTTPDERMDEEKKTDILYAGRLEKHKGIFQFIDAVSKIKVRYPEIRVSIIGHGSCRNDLERFMVEKGLSSTIQLKGWQGDEVLRQSYRESRLLVLPSPDESLGYVGLEAQAIGTPVIAFRNTGTERWCTDNENGFLVYPRTPDKLADRIMEILYDDVLLRRISKTACEHIRLARYNGAQQNITDLYKAALRW